MTLPFAECPNWQLLEDQFNQVYTWHQNTGFVAFFLLPKVMLKLRWSLTMVVDCQSFSGVPFFFLKYRHITLAKDYTLITFPKGRYAANMQRFHSFNLAHGTKFCSQYLCILICCAHFLSNFTEGRAYTFVGLYLSNSACNKHPNILKYQL